MGVEFLFRIFAAGCNANATFFGLPPWYEYLVKAGRMTTQHDTANNLYTCDLVNGFQWQNGDIVLIALGILDIALRLAGLVAVGFVVWGGIQYITSDGSPDRTKAAQTTIINALVGFVIAIIAAAVVSFIGSRIG